MANSQVSTIIGYGLQLAKVGDDTTIPGLDTTTALVRIVDRENRNFIEAPYEVNQPGWDFMIDETGFTLKTAMTITSAVSSGAATVPVTDTTNFSSTGGAAVLYSSNIPDVFLYTGKSTSSGAGNLTGCTQVSMDHSSSDAIYVLYATPTTFGRPRAERWRGDGLTIDTIPYFYGGTGQPNSYFFSVFFDSANTRSYIWIPRDMTGVALLRYDILPTVITTQTQTIDVPARFEEYIIQKVAAHVMRVLSKDPEKIADCEAQAAKIINMAFAKRSTNKRIQLTRRPIRSPSFLGIGHYMDSAGNVY